MRQLHAYPVASRVCVDAVNACRVHLASIDGPDEISLTITPDALHGHDHAVGDGTFVRRELTRHIFPIGSFVRTNREEVGVVVRTSAEDPLRPVIALLRDDGSAVTAHVDLAGSEGQGRHIVETIPAPDGAPSLKDLLDAPSPL